MCSFSYAGCSGKFLREDEEKHMEEKSKEHLSLMAATTLKMSVMLDKVATENEESKKKLLKQVVSNSGFKDDLSVYNYESTCGEYDNSLDWPLRREKSIQLLNQHADENHVTKKVLIKRAAKGNEYSVIFNSDKLRCKKDSVLEE